MSFQIENLESFLTWIKSCPYKYTISSMSGGSLHVKFLIPSNDALEGDRTYKTEPPL